MIQNAHYTDTIRFL